MFLLREGVTIDDAAKSHGLATYDLRPGLDLTGKLVVKQKPPEPAWWVEYLNPAVDRDISQVSSGNMSAALFLDVGGRIVVFTFGYGRFLIDEEAVVHDFGLRATLNSIEPSSMTAVDLRAYEEIVLLTRQQASRASGVDAFDIDRVRDSVTAVVGRPTDSWYGSRISGRDSLSVTVAVEVEDLPDLAEKLISLYELDTYQEHFGWIDNVRPVNDKAVIEALDERLVDALQDDQREGICYLAPPVLLDWDVVGDFSYSSDRSEEPEEYAEVDLDDYLSTWGRRRSVSLKHLKSDKIRFYNELLGQVQDMASIYRSLVFECDHDDRRFVLMAGGWWVIDSELLVEVEDYLADLPVREYDLPASHSKQREDEYLVAAHGAIQDSTVMDKQTIHYGGTRSSIELCDLLTKGGEFIHAKVRSRSSTLSHLWYQGSVSAEAYSDSAVFRAAAKEKVPHGYKNLFPATVPDRSTFSVVYLLIGADAGDPVSSLPFFSKVALSQTYRQLRAAGYSVAIAGVERTRP